MKRFAIAAAVATLLVVAVAATSNGELLHYVAASAFNIRMEY